MEILYQDSEIAVVCKPRGVLSEAGDGSEESVPTLLFSTLGTLLPVHRLDRVVGGVMVYARTKKAAAALSRAVAEGALTKTYIAVVQGEPTPSQGELCDYLFKDAQKNKSFVVKSERKGARQARLTYRVLEVLKTEHGVLSRVEIKLITGRSHQIRVQFSSRGWPLVGDGKYGSRIKAEHVALHAAELRFPHPETGKVMTFAAPCPQEFPFSLFAKSQFEIERKLLVAYPEPSELAKMEGVRRLEMTQTYLTAPTGETARVRMVKEGERVAYISTRKLRIDALRCVEEEKEISEAEYRNELKKADPTRKAIEKVRYQIPYQGHTVELDLYPFWSDRAVAEVELSSPDEAFELPPQIRVIREVTADARYKNVNLARAVPNDELC